MAQSVICLLYRQKDLNSILKTQASHGDTACNLSAGETEAKGHLGLSAGQSSLLGEVPSQ